MTENKYPESIDNNSVIKQNLYVLKERIIFFCYNLKNLKSNQTNVNWADGGGKTPSDVPANPKEIIQEIIDAEDNQIELDLSFKKKIKVI